MTDQHRDFTTTATEPLWDPRTGAWVEPTPPTPPATAPRSTNRAAIAGAVAGAIAAALIAFPIARMSASDQPVERRIEGPITNAGGDESSVVQIAARAQPWVVNIDVSGNRGSLLGRVRGTGSGVIIRSDGHILTNAHVVADAGEINVTLASGDQLTARVVGADDETDIAVVKIDRSDLPAAVIGSVKDLKVGELAVAIGSPLGLEQTVTAGIISAVGRTVPVGAGQQLVDVIQTDAPVTQGNSGGALVNGAGAVVGINAAILASPEVGAEGVAFAIPIDVAMAVADELISSGRATHPWLGVTGGNITPQVADDFGVEQGAFINEVLPRGPADGAGLRPEDVIVSMDGDEIDSMDALVVAIRQHKVGDRVVLGVIRDGKRITLRATLGDKPDNV